MEETSLFTLKINSTHLHIFDCYNTILFKSYLFAFILEKTYIRILEVSV